MRQLSPARMRAALLAVTLLAVALLAAPVHAQRRAPAGAQARRPAATAAPAIDTPARALPARAVVPRAARPPARPYVVAGAALGALAVAGGLALYIASADTECLCSPLGFAPAVAGGALLGAGAGYVVYRARF